MTYCGTLTTIAFLSCDKMPLLIKNALYIKISALSIKIAHIFALYYEI
jgi:fluoride ion exporter CrcB/FEX